MDFGLSSLPLINTLAAPFAQAFNIAEQRRINDRNEANTWEMMRIQKEQTDSAHQRESQDLLKAGLNPVLGLKGSGAQSAVGQAPTATAAKLDPTNMVPVLDGLMSLAQINKINAETDILSPKATMYKEANKGIQGVIQEVGEASKKLGEKFSDWLFQRENADWLDKKNQKMKPKNTGEDYSRDYFRQKPIYNHNWDKTGE